MFFVLVRVVGVLASGLVAGAALCILFLEHRFAGDAAFYTQYKQLLIRALTVPLPALGLAALLVNAYDCSLLFRQGQTTFLALSLTALLLGALAMALTRGGHFPLNAEILAWSPSAPPAGWTSVQAKWWTLHVARTVTSVSSFALFVFSVVARASHS